MLRTLAEALKMDPQTIAESRLELAETLLKECERFVEAGDAVQASEKLYKAVEECIKALAEALKPRTLEEVRKRGKWEAWLLGKAARELSEMLNDDRIRLAWKDAYDIHVWGFHETKYGVEDVKAALPLAKWLLNLTKKIIFDSIPKT